MAEVSRWLRRDTTGPATGGTARRVWQVARVSLAALWVVWAVASWWTAPRQTDQAQVRADLAAGRIQSYQWADQWSDSTTFSWNDQGSLRSWGSDGPLLVWTTSGERVHYTIVETDPEPDAAALTQELRAAGIDQSHPTGVLLSLASKSGVLIMVSLAILYFGPTPATGTRWFWFWLLVGVPLGFGFVYWLVRERPWASPAVSDDRRWYAGIAIAFVTTLGGSLLAWGLHRILGEWLIPSTLFG